MADTGQVGTYHLSFVGSNTPTQVTAKPTILYSLSVAHNGGSAGYLQVYDNGTGAITAGTNMQMSFAVASGTFAAGTPAQISKDFGPNGVAMNGGLSYLWATGTTGTVAHETNAVINIVYKPVNTA